MYRKSVQTVSECWYDWQRPNAQNCKFAKNCILLVRLTLLLPSKVSSVWNQKFGWYIPDFDKKLIIMVKQDNSPVN